MNLKRAFKNEPSDNSIVLICVLRDEILLLPYFIEYYTKMGVSHFIFVDNDSIDDSQKYLCEHPFENIKVYHTTEEYSKNLYGVSWVNEILNAQLKNKWCIVVDVDELIQPKDKINLPHLRANMQNSNASILVTCLLDFYPSKLNEKIYESGTPFQEHSDMFDKMNDDNVFYAIQNDGVVTIKGGLRHRLLNSHNKPNNDSVCLTKKTFFKYDFYETHHLSEGCHWLMPNNFIDWLHPDNNKLWKSTNKFLRFYENLQILGHFKYLKPNVFEYFEERVNRNQDWDGGIRVTSGSIEYQTYIENKSEKMEDVTTSEMYNHNNDDLYEKTLNNVLKKL